MRPIYKSRSIDLFDRAREEMKAALAQQGTGEDVRRNLSGRSNDSGNFALAAGVTCYPTARKIRLQSSTGEQIAMFEFEAYSSGINIALQGTATQSSDRHNGQLLYASNAIDGNDTTFSHTNDPSASWEVDLGDVYPIESILIKNRYCGRNPNADPIGCLCRLSNATLTLLDETESVVITKTVGDTCGTWNVSQTFSEYSCLTDSATSGSPGNDTDLTLGEYNETDLAILDEMLMSQFHLWAAIELVYAGSRWFGTLNFSPESNADNLHEIFTDEYHAFWNNLYEERTFFISDPTSGASPVGVDFYKNQNLDVPQWDDYGPFGLLTPLHNVSGKGYFHCLGSNLTAVKVSSGTGDYGS
jgi:hypothetical protein